MDFAKVLHYIGAGVAFPSSMLFVCLQSALTYRLAKTQEEYRIGHLRVGMALVALIALVLSILNCHMEGFIAAQAVRVDGVRWPPAGENVGLKHTQGQIFQRWEELKERKLYFRY